MFTRLAMQGVDNQLQMSSTNAFAGTIKLFEYSLQLLDDHPGHGCTPTRLIPSAFETQGIGLRANDSEALALLRTMYTRLASIARNAKRCLTTEKLYARGLSGTRE